MKKKTTKLLTLLLSLLIAFSVISGCNNGGPKDVDNPDVIYISAWDSGYGVEWLNNIAKGFMDKNPNITVKVESTTLRDKATAPLSSKTYYDLIFCDNTDLVGGSTTTKFPGYDTTFTEITDVVTTKLEGENVSIAEKLNNEMLKFSTINDKFYYLPAMVSLWGMTYNNDVLKNYFVPKTSYEMQVLCNELKSDKSITAPIIFSGDTDYWNPILWTWWAQYDGKKSYDAFFTGCDVNGKMTIDIFSSLGRLRALEEVETFLTPVNAYSDPSSIGMLYMQAQLKYLQGKYAFMANGSWLENEMMASFNESGAEMADIRFMDVPVISSIVEKLSFYSEGETAWAELSLAKKTKYDAKLKATIDYIDSGKTTSAPEGVTSEDIDIIEEARTITYLTGMYYNVVIPCYSQKTSVAKEFLKYMYSNEGIRNYLATDCGAVMPVKYDFLSETETSEYSNIRKQLMKALNGKNVIYTDYNQKIVRLGGLKSFAISGTLETNFGALYEADRVSAYDIFMYDYNYYRTGNAWANILAAAGY